jgi:orotate phosphoribosyltransferase
MVDDAISAGSAVRGTLRTLRECGARPAALGALIVFGERAARFASDEGLPLEAVAELPFAMWLPAQCPLCAAGVPCERVSDAAPRRASV